VRPYPAPRLGSQVLQTGASVLFGSPRISKSDLSERSRPSLSFLPASRWMVNPSAMAYRFSCRQLAPVMLFIEDGRRYREAMADFRAVATVSEAVIEMLRARYQGALQYFIN
jgi:hypothetical protein